EGMLDADEPVGRRMDFLVQELNREVNTIASKSQWAPIASLAVELKAEIERIREQVQNVEQGGAVAKNGLMLVISAPSGTGKTTLARRLVERTPGARFSISATTRPPRGAERDGVDYYFVGPARFQEMIDRGELL